MSSQPPDEKGTFRSGMAARLAGIPPATLRVWERRYQVAGAPPEGSAHRRYTQADVARLALIKTLVDAGHGIGSLARLPIAALREIAEGPARAARADIRVALVGEGLEALREEIARRRGPMRVAAECADVAQAADALRGTAVELLIAGLPTLDDESAGLVETLRELAGARGVVVAYRFGSRAQLESLRDRGHVPLRAPLDVERLAALAEDLAQRAPRAPWPATRLHPPRFDEATLARLASASTTVACECPRHLVELVRSLGAFERYSAECGSRNPADAHLHRELQRAASTARAMMEEALAELAEADGLERG